MSAINLDELLAQRAEATGAEEGRIPFEFAGQTFTFRDPFLVEGDDQDELEELSELGDGDLLAEFWMGEDEFARFCEAGGNANFFSLVVRENAQRTSGFDAEGRPTRSNRSSRRAAERKRRKQH